MVEIRWSALAVEDLEEICNYIAKCFSLYSQNHHTFSFFILIIDQYNKKLHIILFSKPAFQGIDYYAPLSSFQLL
jgi:hypothetical protein